MSGEIHEENITGGTTMVTILVTTVDGQKVMAPLGSPPPEHAPAGLWLPYNPLALVNKPTR